MRSRKNAGVDRHQLWAEFRFSVIGHLLACPPEKGELKCCLEDLARRTWRHPLTDEMSTFSRSTIERWYYRTIKNPNPIDALRRKVRKDAGVMTVIDTAVAALLGGQYKDHPTWSYQLHTDNLEVLIEEKAKESRVPSYSSVKRYMKGRGLRRRKKARNDKRAGAIQAFERSLTREKRLFEALYVHALWHLDFHDGSRQVIEPDGNWHTPICFAALDDKSRLACHVQWYLNEDTSCLVQGYGQATQKRGRPREQMTDNGSAMRAAEFTAGLSRLSIVWSPTMEYSPEQNGKQEKFWDLLEGRLMAMLENVKHLTLKDLNDATCAWVEMEYNRRVHSETGIAPIEAVRTMKGVANPSPTSEEVRDAFCFETTRTQRDTDGTIRLDGIRFQIPSRYRTLSKLTIRYARWDLSWVYLVNPETGKKLCHIYPVDKEKNAVSGRRAIETDLVGAPAEPRAGEIAPLLKRLMAEYAATGLPPAYIPNFTDEEETP